MTAIVLCECGCGEPTRVPAVSCAEKGWTRGVPLRFVNGHNGRLKRRGVFIEDRGYGTPCWVWQGAAEGDNGYGRLNVDGKRQPAHRYFYERAHGRIPPGMQLDHLCRVPLCVNPDHLEAVTGTENVRRGNVCKLTEAAVAEIRRHRDQFFADHPLNTKGRPRKRFPQGELGKLAERYGVSKFTIISVLKERSWV